MEIDRITPTRRPDGRVVMRQTWRDLLFLHWPVDAGQVQALLPPGLTVDTFDGQAYVGLVPFTMRNVRPVWSPSVPGLSHFHECNVRTYVHRDGQEPGVWFFSLDAANWIAVQIARSLFHLPYFPARMSLARDGKQITYHTRRRGGAPGTADCHAVYTPTGTPAPALPGSLPFFLAERYLLYSARGGSLYRGQVHHTPYPLQPVQLHELSQTLTAAGGFPLPDRLPPLMHFARGVTVDIFGLQKIS